MWADGFSRFLPSPGGNIFEGETAKKSCFFVPLTIVSDPSGRYRCQTEVITHTQQSRHIHKHLETSTEKVDRVKRPDRSQSPTVTLYRVTRHEMRGWLIGARYHISTCGRAWSCASNGHIFCDRFRRRSDQIMHRCPILCNLLSLRHPPMYMLSMLYRYEPYLSLCAMQCISLFCGR